MHCTVDFWVSYRTKRSNYSPERPQCTQQPKDAQDAKDAWTAVSCEGDENVHQGDDDKKSVHHIPATLQVGMFPHHKPLGYHL